MCKRYGIHLVFKKLNTIKLYTLPNYVLLFYMHCLNVFMIMIYLQMYNTYTKEEKTLK